MWPTWPGIQLKLALCLGSGCSTVTMLWFTLLRKSNGSWQKRTSNSVPSPPLSWPWHGRLFPLPNTEKGAGRLDHDPHGVQDEVGKWGGVLGLWPKTTSLECSRGGSTVAKSAFVSAVDTSRKTGKYIICCEKCTFVSVVDTSRKAGKYIFW